MLRHRRNVEEPATQAFSSVFDGKFIGTSGDHCRGFLRAVPLQAMVEAARHSDLRAHSTLMLQKLDNDVYLDLRSRWYHLGVVLAAPRICLVGATRCCDYEYQR